MKRPGLVLLILLCFVLLGARAQEEHEDHQRPEDDAPPAHPHQPIDDDVVEKHYHHGRIERRHEEQSSESPSSGIVPENEDDRPAEGEAASGNSKRIWGGSASSNAGGEEEELQEQNVGSSPPEPMREQDDASSSPGEDRKESRRIWGGSAEGGAAAATGGDGETNDSDEHDHSHAASTDDEVSATEETMERHHEKKKAHLPFVSKKTHHSANPPEGYTVSARVYTDPHDKLAHFDDSPLRIPYWDCGAAGSTTSPLPLKDAYFRHALTGSTSWSGTDGKHAVLVIALSPILMELNSGEVNEFGAGSVILLEDVLLPGHKMKPAHNNGNQGVSLLFLTLPQQYIHTGREHTSLPKAFLKHKSRDDPCPTEHSGDLEELANRQVEETGGTLPSSPTFTLNVRKVALSVLGLSMTTLAADFLGKTAPLWLAVGVGGTCFVVAGTWGIAVAGDALITAAQIWYERRRLGGANDAETQHDEGPDLP